MYINQATFMIFTNFVLFLRQCSIYKLVKVGPLSHIKIKSGSFEKWSGSNPETLKNCHHPNRHQPVYQSFYASHGFNLFIAVNSQIFVKLN